MDFSIPSSTPSIPCSSQATPKRKRDSVPPTPPTSSPSMRLNTNIPGAVLLTSDDGITGSPRTKVAYNFQGLQLEDGGAVSKLDLQASNDSRPEPQDDVMSETAVRKRVRIMGSKESRLRGAVKEIPETPVTKGFQIVIGPERIVDSLLAEKAEGVVLHNEIDPIIFKAASALNSIGSGLGKAKPTMNRRLDSKSRLIRKRMGTPPLFGSAEASLEMQDGDVEPRIVDPDRAALTWHDDEITGHTPDDPDDDGEGINGIGFKPTPAIAYARNEKRRIQMAEYRNREAKEARAKRSERRRGNEANKSRSVEEETARRVRFLEGEVKKPFLTS